MAADLALESNVLRELAEAGKPLDAYRLARRTGSSVMACGQALSSLQAQGKVRTDDPQGTANDLARQFVLA